MARPTGITLYQFTTCPYCSQVRKTLAGLDLQYEAVTLEPRETVQVDGLGETTVPAIHDGETVMNESGDIITYLETTYGSAA